MAKAKTTQKVKATSKAVKANAKVSVKAEAKTPPNEFGPAKYEKELNALLDKADSPNKFHTQELGNGVRMEAGRTGKRWYVSLWQGKAYKTRIAGLYGAGNREGLISRFRETMASVGQQA